MNVKVWTYPYKNITCIPSWKDRFRSSQRRCSLRKGVLRNFSKFTGKHLCQRLYFNKVAGLRPATLLQKRLWHRCFPVNFEKFLRIPFLQNTSRRLLLPFHVISTWNTRSVFAGMNVEVQVEMKVKVWIEVLHLELSRISTMEFFQKYS